LERQYVVFKLGEEEYGIEILMVQEIIRPIKTTKLPNSPDYVLGITNLRGNVIPIVDLKQRFNLPISKETEGTRIIVVKQGNNAVGIYVDQVQEVVHINDKEIKLCEEIYSRIDKEFINGVASLNGRLVILLNLSATI
jgi:purine-binding chemotaxis protein CheW